MKLKIMSYAKMHSKYSWILFPIINIVILSLIGACVYYAVFEEWLLYESFGASIYFVSAGFAPSSIDVQEMGKIRLRQYIFASLITLAWLAYGFACDKI